MGTLLLSFPTPSKAHDIKGASFIATSDKHGTVVRLDTSPSKRRSQVSIFRQAVQVLGKPKEDTYGLHFQRDGPCVIVDSLPADLSSLYLHDVVTPAMLRVWLAVCNTRATAYNTPAGIPDAHPQDVTDFAHLLWLLREKSGIIVPSWVNGSKPAPVDISGLTPVFAGAKIVLVNGTPIARKGALHGISV